MYVIILEREVLLIYYHSSQPRLPLVCRWMGKGVWDRWPGSRCFWPDPRSSLPVPRICHQHRGCQQTLGQWWRNSSQGSMGYVSYLCIWIYMYLVVFPYMCFKRYCLNFGSKCGYRCFELAFPHPREWPQRFSGVGAVLSWTYLLPSWTTSLAADRVTGHTRGCACERACLKLEGIWTRK